MECKKTQKNPPKKQDGLHAVLRAISLKPLQEKTREAVLTGEQSTFHHCDTEATQSSTTNM